MTVTRVLENTLSQLSATLEGAEPARQAAFDPRVKVIGALVLTVAAVSARRWEVIAVLLALQTAAALFLGIAWKRLLAGWAGGLFFAAVVAVPAIFTSGWQLALLLVLRSEASLTCWMLVILTTPFSLVLRALQTLYVPTVFIAILSMTFRYIFLLVQTAQDMLLSRRSRIVGRMNGADHRRLISSTAGVLLGKSVQMSDDVYQAMASRGFRGEIRVMQDFQMTARDWVVLGVVLALAAAVFVMGR
jgi:cobalt ECF transporter T component CbiQ